MTRNGFKDALVNRRPQIGLWLSLANAYAAEICAGAPVDWLLIDGEHAPNDIASILAQLQAVAAYPVHPVVRPLSADPNLLKQLLDIGVENLLVPMIDSAEEAEALVRAVRYPPRGARGIGHALGRASRWTRNPGYFDAWEQDACIVVQVESKAALDNLEAIAAVDGIDGLFIGPADLAASLGYPGQFDHPVVKQAIGDALARIVASGKPAGTIAVGEDAAKAFLDHGGSFVAAGVDVLILAQGVDRLGQALRAARA